MTGVWKAYKIFDYLKLIGIYISSLAVLIMMVLIVYDVIMRNLFSSSIRGGFEIIQNYMMPLVVFPGLAFMYASGVLPKMDLLLGKVNKSMQRTLIITCVGSTI
jgi:TRAP-type C4-dicarboxylate transport system permease small subunit